MPQAKTDHDITIIWNKIAYDFVPDGGWTSMFDKNITWDTWLELVYVEMSIRGLPI